MKQGPVGISSNNAVEISFCGISDIGRVRKNNEDRFVIYELTCCEEVNPAAEERCAVGPRGMLLLVADGMGGEACGEVASHLAVSAIPSRFCETLAGKENLSEGLFASLLQDAIEHANRLIFEKSQSNAVYRGMGTTVTAAGVSGGTLVVGQVGDSRAYLIRNGAFVQLTRDQTFLNYLADLGADLPANLERDHRRSILTQAVGASPSVEVKVTLAELRQKDRILLCSDGLYTMVAPADLALLASRASLKQACRELVDSANKSGGNDNITAVVAEVAGRGLPPADPSSPPQVKEFHRQNFEA